MTAGLTDVVLSAHFLQDVDLLHRGLSDLLDLLLSHPVGGSDVDDLHRVLLVGVLVDAAAHHAAHPSEDQGETRERVRAGKTSVDLSSVDLSSVNGHSHFVTRLR